MHVSVVFGRTLVRSDDPQRTGARERCWGAPFLPDLRFRFRVWGFRADLGASELRIPFGCPSSKDWHLSSCLEFTLDTSMS